MIPIETLRTEAFSMQYFRFGTGSRVMVIIPGLSLKSVMLSAEQIAAAYAVFAADYTVYVFDRRADLPDAYTAPDAAEDTAAAMRALHLTQAYIFGASQGGMIALCIAAKHPELVSRVAVGSTAAKLPDGAEKQLRDWIRMAKYGFTTALTLLFSQACYSEALFLASREPLLKMAASVTDEDMARFLILARGSAGLDLLPLLDAIRCPVLAIGGAKDRILGAEPTRELAERLHCGCYIYPEGAHAVYDEAPDYKDRLYAFFQQQLFGSGTRSAGNGTAPHA